MDLPVDTTDFLKDILQARLNEQRRLLAAQAAQKPAKMPKKKISKKAAYPPQSEEVIPFERKTSVSLVQGPRFLPQDYNDTATLAKREESVVETYDRSKASFDAPLSNTASELRLEEDKRRRIRRLDGHESVVEIDSQRGTPSEMINRQPTSLETKCCGFSCKRYHVSKELDENYEMQSRFLKYISIGYLLQISFIIAWVALISLEPTLGKVIKVNFNWSYLPLGLFFISKIIVRTQTQIRKIQPAAQIIIITLRVICIAYYCGAVKVSSDMIGTIINTSLCILLQTTAFFAWTANYVAYDVTHLETTGIAAIVTFVFSLTMFIAWACYGLLEQSLMESLVFNWLPSAVTCELISVIVLVEIRQLVRGMRFPIEQGDWIFALLYV